MADERTKLLTRSLAKRFANGPVGPCACVGAQECLRLDCPTVWEYFLSDPQILKDAMAMYSLFDVKRNNNG